MSEIWPDRFIKREMLPAGELARRFNINNPRSHPEAQRDATEDSLNKVGWFDEVSISTNGGGSASLADNPDAVLFDGHGRVELTLVRGGESALVPVKWYQLDKEETDFALLVKDQTTGMADYIPEKLAALMERTKAMTADRPGLSEMMNRLKEKVADGILADGDKKQRISRTVQVNGLYNSGDGHDVEPFKLAHRVEAIWQARGKKAIDLYSGQGQLASWYKRRFESVITIDKAYPVGDVDYQMTASQFISQILPDHIDFDFVDFDDEGTPAREIQEFFNVIAGKKNNSFILALTDGNGMTFKLRGRFDFSVYLIDDAGIRRSTFEDYECFEKMVSNFIVTCATGAKFTPTNLSSYRGREENVLYQTWLIEPAEVSDAGYDTHPVDTVVSLS